MHQERVARRRRKALPWGRFAGHDAIWPRRNFGHLAMSCGMQHAQCGEGKARLGVERRRLRKPVGCAVCHDARLAVVPCEAGLCRSTHDAVLGVTESGCPGRLIPVAVQTVYGNVITCYSTA